MRVYRWQTEKRCFRLRQNEQTSAFFDRKRLQLTTRPISARPLALFQSTLNGLLDGDEGLGLPGTRDQAIRDQLSIVQGLWEQYKPVLDAIDTSDAGLTKAAELNLPLLKEMNKAVKMYEKAAK